MCPLSLFSRMMMRVLKLWNEIHQVRCKRSKTGNLRSVSSLKCCLQWPHKYVFFFSVGPAWKWVGVKFLSALGWKGPHIPCWLLMLPTAAWLLRDITLDQGCCVRCLFLIPSLHSNVTLKQRKNYFYYSVLLQKCTLIQHVMASYFCLSFLFRVTSVKFRHRWYGIL